MSMYTSDQEKYSNTPTSEEVIAGVELRNAKRKSRWPAYCDVAQSVTGLLLGLFLFCHMAFTSSIQLGKDVFWNLVAFSGGYPIDGEEHAWMHVVLIGAITLLVIIHALMALRRFPTSYHMFHNIKSQYQFIAHRDTTLWIVQIVTAVILTGMVFPHVTPMLLDPHAIGPNLSSVHTYHNGLLWTFVFLVATELHGMIGLYRLCVKWDVFAGNREALRKIMYCVVVLMIACGSMTMWTYYSNGKALVESGEPIVKYEPVNNWWK